MKDEKRNTQKPKNKSKIWLILLFVCLTVAIIAAVVLVKQLVGKKAATATYEELQEKVNDVPKNNAEEQTIIREEIKEVQSVTTDELAGEKIANAKDFKGNQTLIAEETKEGQPVNTEIFKEEQVVVLEELNVGSQEQSGINVPVKNLDWAALHEQNEDIYAWIYVPDTTVDYPILRHPTDNSYYLNYNIDGTKGYPGCIYTENYNSKDFTDPHTVIYGHNLKDKSMFSSLHNFENVKLFNENHYIYIYTESNVYVYQIFAAYEFNAIHLLDNYDLSNEYVYEQYIKDIFNVPNTNARVANIRNDIEVTKEDRIVTLSTCTSDHNSNFRFLVVGVLLNP